MNSASKKIAVAAVLAAIICIATFAVKIPTPLRGYMNLGDCAVLLSGWLLPPGYAFLAAGFGSAFADVLGGYAVYAPATFAIKGIMAVIAYGVFRILSKRFGKFRAWLISGLMAEVLMVLGYYGFEGLLYGFGPSLVNIPANAIQGAAGLILGLILVKILHKNKISPLS